MENQANIESPKISYIATVLRMDRRICTGDVTCHLYDRTNEGLPCFASIENCEYLIKAFKEPAEEEAEKKLEDLDSKVENQKTEIEDLEEKIRDLETEKGNLELKQTNKNSNYDGLKQRYNELLATTGIVSGKFPKEE
jgi:predicted nuclease with TOPRIM domain